MTFTIPSRSFVLLGSNLGDRYDNLVQARASMTSCGHIVKTSHVYLTKAWGDSSQPDHYNQIIEMETTLQPKDLMDCVLAIERKMGRKRSEEIAPRVIDIDILFYDNLICESPHLSLPHPRLHLRNFTLIPLMEIAPHLRHPSLDKTIEELYLSCQDQLEVLMLETHG